MLTIRNLPLYWRFTDQKSIHRNIPSKIDFTFDIDQTLGMIIEKKDKPLLDILHNVYEEDANIGYMIDGHNLSQTYGEDYIRFLKKNVGSFSNKKIIDIGCGGCTLLEKLKSEGANVLGIDPSPVANREAKRKKIPLINDFFSPGLIDGYMADTIVQMDVFEHIFDPISLLKAEGDALSDNGLIIINVPNCEYSVENGDISMAIPQHVNMFTRYSICKLVESAGLYVTSLELSNYGSAIYCAASKNKNKSLINSNDFKYQLDWVYTFFDKADIRICKFEKFFDNLNNSKNLAYFIFQRSLPYTCAIGASIDNARFFDNNILWRNKFLDGIPSKVENFEDFKANPPKETLIMSNTFGKEIKKQIVNIDKNLTVKLQEDIFV